MFTAAEAARVTDVQPAAQRNWRRRGFLPKQDGWARFSPGDLVEMVFRKTMSDLGMPHYVASEEMRDACILAEAWAMTHPNAVKYEQGTKGLMSFEGDPEHRFVLAQPPWPEPEPGNEPQFRMVRDEAELLSVINGLARPGTMVIDLKAIASKVVESVDYPLFTVRLGPGDWEINGALNSAHDGNVEAQKDLDAIGIDWRGMFETVKR